MNGFSGDIYLQQHFSSLIEKYHIKTVIEFGTYKGDTAKQLSGMVENVVTVESQDNYYYEASRNLLGRDNVKCYLGKSQDTLLKIWNEINGHPNYLIFSDSHWHKPTPTLGELFAIAQLNIKPVIIIHDFFCPDHPEFGYDSYDDFTYNWQSVEASVHTIYGDDFEIAYPTVVSGAKRGYITIKPK